MTSLPEQLSAARTRQFEAQLDFLRAVTTQVFESAEQVIALNLDASRAAVERSSNAVRQLFDIHDPRDLMSLGSHGQEQFQQMLAYSRELFSIAAAVPVKLARSAGAAAQAPAAEKPLAAAQDRPAEKAGATAQDRPADMPATAAAPWPEPAGRAAAEGAHAATGVKPSKKPVVATAPEAEPEPAAKAKPIAKAASKVVPKPASAQRPLSSPVVQGAASVEIPPVKPIEAAPPPPPVAGTPEIESKQAQFAPSKADRKK